MITDAPLVVKGHLCPPFSRRGVVKDGYVVLSRYAYSWINGIGSERCWTLETVAVAKLTKGGEVSGAYRGEHRSDLMEVAANWRAAGKPSPYEEVH